MFAVCECYWCCFHIFNAYMVFSYFLLKLMLEDVHIAFLRNFLFSQCRFAGMACGDSYAVELPQAGEAVISGAVSC